MAELSHSGLRLKHDAKKLRAILEENSGGKTTAGLAEGYKALAMLEFVAVLNDLVAMVRAKLDEERSK